MGNWECKKRQRIKSKQSSRLLLRRLFEPHLLVVGESFLLVEGRFQGARGRWLGVGHLGGLCFCQFWCRQCFEWGPFHKLEVKPVVIWAITRLSTKRVLSWGLSFSMTQSGSFCIIWLKSVIGVNVVQWLLPTAGSQGNASPKWPDSAIASSALWKDSSKSGFFKWL